MRWLNRGLRKVVKFLALSAIVSIATLFALVQLFESSNSEYLWLIPALIIAFLVFKSLTLPTFSRARYLNSQGYIVLRESNELEHRAIAKEIVGRELYRNEVVHHINGRRDDNRIENLCLMDHEKHEHFHAWIRWQKEKRGHYPSIKKQKHILREEYGGALLENATFSQSDWIDAPDLATAWPSRVDSELKPSPVKQRPPEEKHVILSNDQRRLLFTQLRDERKRISAGRQIPAYEIFVDKTLLEMANHLPISKHAMLEIPGVTREKYEAYGSYFVEVIRKFRADFEVQNRNKKERA